MRDYKLRKRVTKLEENGGGGGALVCRVIESTNALDHTWNEINDAMRAGKNVVLIDDTSDSSKTASSILTALMDQGQYMVVVSAVEEMLVLYANSADAYPTFTDT